MSGAAGLLVYVLIVRQLTVGTGECGDGLVDCQGVLYAEDSAPAALQGIQVRSATQSFAQVACKRPHICALAAGHTHDRPWQA